MSGKQTVVWKGSSLQKWVSNERLWLLYQSTAAMSIDSGVCSFYQMVTLYYYTSVFVVVVVFVFVGGGGTKNIATIGHCHVEKLTSTCIYFFSITSCGLWPTWQPRRWQSDSERDHLRLDRFLRLSQRVRFNWPNHTCVPGQWTVVSICSYLQRCDGSAYII